MKMDKNFNYKERILNKIHKKISKILLHKRVKNKSLKISNLLKSSFKEERPQNAVVIENKVERGKKGKKRKERQF